MDNFVRAISKGGAIVISAIDSTEIVRKMENLHQTSAVVSAALGRLLTAASLMGGSLKNAADSITLRVQGDGPIGMMVAVSDGKGNVRGYADNPVVELDRFTSCGKLDVGTAVGKNGYLTISRDNGAKNPYIGTVPLVSGEIAEDITSYYAKSEQIPTVCALGVLVEKDLTIKRAGGLLLQLLPGANEDEIELIENNIFKMDSLTQLLESGKTPWDIVQKTLYGFNPEILNTSSTNYQCSCSREKTLGILSSLGAQELESLRKEQEFVSAECHFCNNKYQFLLDDLLLNFKHNKS